jgi:hypothetical protein
MTVNVDQHKTFEEGMHSMEIYFTEVRQNPTIYDGKKVASMIEKFGPVFVLHMREEIGTLDPARLRDIFPVEEDMKLVWAEMTKWIIAHVDKLNGLPFVS